MTNSVSKPSKRGWPAQRDRRQGERSARVEAVAFCHQMAGRGIKPRQAAQQLGLVPRTFANWSQRWGEDLLEARGLGRPCKQADPSRLLEHLVRQRDEFCMAGRPGAGLHIEPFILDLRSFRVA